MGETTLGETSAENVGLDTLVRLAPDPNADVRRRPLSMNLLRRLWRLMAPHRALRRRLLAAVVVRSLQLPVLTWAIAATIEGPIAGKAPPGTILAAAAGVLGLAAATQVVFTFRQRWSLEMGERIVFDLRRDLFRRIQAMPLAYFGRTKTGRVVSRFTSDCEAVRTGVQDVFFVSMIGVGQMTGAAVLMAVLDWRLFASVLAVGPLTAAIAVFMRSRLSRAYREVQESFARVTTVVAESIAIVRVTQTLARETINTAAFAALTRDHARYNMNIARQTGRMIPAIDWTQQLATAVVIIVASIRTSSATDPMPVGDVIQFWFLTGLFFGPIQVLAGQYDAALSAMAGAERVFRILDTPLRGGVNGTLDPSDPVLLPPDPVSPPPDRVSPPPDRVSPPIDAAGEIVLSDVRFGYDAGHPILHGIDLTAPAGKTTALVGPTGGGKTTTAAIMARFYAPDAGRVTLDGIDLGRFAETDLRRRIAVVPQSSYLFDGTLRDNLRAGRGDISDADIDRCLDDLGCREIVERLSGGLGFQVSAGGRNLSTGQRQIFCLVRAVVGRPRVLILDEATASIDSVTEARLQEAIARSMRGRTCVVIAHRLSTIRDADQIAVIDAGRVVQTGRHDDLVRTPGIYQSLHRSFAA